MKLPRKFRRPFSEYGKRLRDQEEKLVVETKKKAEKRKKEKESDSCDRNTKPSGPPIE